MLYKLKMKGEKLHGNIVTNETSGNILVSKEISQYNIICKSIHILLGNDSNSVLRKTGKLKIVLILDL